MQQPQFYSNLISFLLTGQYRTSLFRQNVLQCYRTQRSTLYTKSRLIMLLTFCDYHRRNRCQTFPFSPKCECSSSFPGPPGPFPGVLRSRFSQPGNVSAASCSNIFSEASSRPMHYKRSAPKSCSTHSEENPVFTIALSDSYFYLVLVAYVHTLSVLHLPFNDLKFTVKIFGLAAYCRTSSFRSSIVIYTHSQLRTLTHSLHTPFWAPVPN